MKIQKFKFLFFAIASVALISGCKDKSTEVVSQYVGNYVISHAELAEPLTVTTVETGPIPVPVPAGTDITQLIQNALLSAVSCSSASKSYIELRKDNSIYMSCQGANELNAGTWEEVDNTTLKLNLNSSAVPSSPTGIVLTASDIVKNSTGFRGKTNVPIPKAMIAAVIAPLTLDPSTAAVLNVVFYIDFAKK